MQRTTLVLLPGLDGTDIFFRPLVAALPAWITPVCIEYPVSGPNTYADLLPVARAACDGQEDFFLLGWSFSGPLALLAAATAPRGLRGVILCASFVRRPWPMMTPFRFALRAPVARCAPLISWVLAVLGGYSSPTFAQDTKRLWSRVPPTTLAARTRAALGVDVRRELRQCPVPVLYLAASRDVVVRGRNAAEIGRALPSVRTVIIEGPHLALYFNATAAADVITTFVRDTGVPPPCPS